MFLASSQDREPFLPPIGMENGSGMLPTSLTSFPRPIHAASASAHGGSKPLPTDRDPSYVPRRCFGMSSAVPGSPSPPAPASTPTTPTSSSGFRVGSPGGGSSAATSFSSLATSPGGSGINGYGFGCGYGLGTASTTLAPDPHAQKAILEQLLERQLSEGDFWYVVVAEWLEHLKKYLGIASARKYYCMQKRVTTLPGPIVTRRDFAHTVDVVHEDAWRMLYQWYGLAEGHKPMKLVVYRYARGPEIEHNVNTFKLMLTTSPPEDFHNVRFSKMEKVGHVEWRVRQLYAVPLHQESRLWAKADAESEWRLLLSRDKSVGRALDSDSDFTRPVLALELLEEEGVWNHPPETALDAFLESSAQQHGLDLVPAADPSDPASSPLPQDYPTGPLYEHSIFDDITTAWEVDIHDQIDNMGKTFLERLHSNFAVFVQRARDYVGDREVHLRERERQIAAREGVTERLAASLQDKEKHLALQLSVCEEKITEYERRRQELERETQVRKEETETELQKQREALQRETQALQAEKESFSNEIKKMAELHVMQEGRVKLDIGGHQFTTSVLTLTKEADSMLAAMFSGRHALKTEADGSYFIDRDGTHFRHILNYLRDGCIKEGTLPYGEAVLRELLTEAEYYQLSGLVDIIGAMLFKTLPYDLSGKDGDTFV